MIPLQEAWSILGRDINTILSEVSCVDKRERPKALWKLVDGARKTARTLLAKHHPDRGGDPNEFRKVQQSLDSIVFHTEEYERKVLDSIRRIDETNSRHLILIDPKDK